MLHDGAAPLRVLFANATSAENALLRILVTRLEGLVAFTACTFDEPGPLDTQLAELGVEVIHLPPATTGAIPRAALAMRRVLRRQPIDLVHSNLFGPGLATEIARLLPGTPPSVFTRHHDRSHHELGKRFHVAADRWTARRSAAVIAPSPPVRDTLVDVERVPAGRVTVVPHGVEWDRMVPDPVRRDAWRAQLGGPLLVAVGRIDPIKAYDDLLVAFSHARREIPDLRLAIAGTGAPGASERLRAEVSGIGLDGAVHLLGHIDDVASLLAAADGFVQASRAESFGLAALEAVGLGVPTAVTTPGGIAEIVGGVAPPIAPGDRVALARRMVEIVDDPAARSTAEAAAPSVRARFSAERMADGHLAVYEAVTRRRRAPSS